jgi:hypothetical protein
MASGYTAHWTPIDTNLAFETHLCF